MIIVAALKQVHHEFLENTCKDISDVDPNNWSCLFIITRQNGSIQYSWIIYASGSMLWNVDINSQFSLDESSLRWLLSKNN